MILLLFLVFWKILLLGGLIVVLIIKSLNHLHIDLLFGIFIPLFLFLLFLYFYFFISLLFIFVVISSLWITYSGKERGHPCLKLLSNWMEVDMNSLLITKDILLLYRILINCINLFEKPILFIILYKKSWSTLLNAFSWSICNM